MMAALVAAHHGSNVLLLEKNLHGLCNTELSGGLIQAAGTRYQSKAGIEDHPDAMVRDIVGVNGGKCDMDVTTAICRRSADVVHFLADVVGLDFHLDETVLYKGHSTHRMHTTSGELGSEIVVGMRKAIRSDARITFVDNAKVTGLIDEGAAIRGVTAGDPGERIAAGATLLSCDGFGANREMVANYLPSIQGATYIGSENNSGDGISWGQAAGAAVDRMTAYQGHCHVNPKHGTRLGGALPHLGSIIVNTDGRRFAAEDQGYSQFAAPLLAERDGVAVEIFDQDAFDAAWQTGSFRQAHEAGAIRRAESVAELADAFSLPLEVLSEELATYNEITVEGHDPLGRTDALRRINPPYYGSLVTGALVHTQGGLRIDSNCRVQRADGSVIGNLYAAGGTAAGISGVGPDGYMSGNGLIQALATGMIAGDELGASDH